MAALPTDTAAAVRSATTELAPRRACISNACVLAAWVGLIGLSYALIERVQATGADVKLDAAPLVGVFDVRVNVRVVGAVVVATTVALAGPAFARRARWSHLLLSAAAVAAI